MKKENLSRKEAKALRQKAEEIFKLRVPVVNDNISEKDTSKLIHELEIRKIELEILAKELKLKEQELYHFDMRQEAFFSSFPNIIMEVDNDKKYTWANRSGFEFFGDDVIGKEAALYFVGEQETYNSVIPLFKGSEDVFYLESWQRRKDGEIRLLSWWCRVLKDENNNVTGAFSSAYDITDQKRHEEELRASKEIIEGVINTIPTRVFWKDKNLRYLGCNLAFANDAGFDDINDVIGKDDFQMTWRDQAELYRGVDFEVVKSGKAKLHIEEPQTTPDGRNITILTNKIPIKNTKGEVCGVLGTYMDISERKQAELLLQKQNREIEAQSEEYKQLNEVLHQTNSELIKANEKAEESRNKINTLINTIPDLIWLKDTQGVYLQCNKRFEDFFGAKENEIVGKTDYDFVDKKTGDFFRAHDKEAMLAGVPTINEEQITFAIDGHKEYLETIKMPLYDLNKKIIGILGVGRDITQRIIGKQELIKAKEKAEESDRLKSAFLANMSHEIRTPMNGILGFAELLKEPKLTGEEQQKYIDVIEKSGIRMLNIINDIINISKIESGQMGVSVSETNINEQIDYIYTFFKTEAEKKGIKLLLKNSLPANEATIRTDREKIYAILTNLVKNALKFTREGFIEFGYRKDKGFLEFFVKDTGAGINQEQQEIIFERFRQGSESLIRNYEGSGLGLSISKAYVEMLGGKIWVYSEPGEGSAFYFTIPCQVEQEEKAMTQKPDSENGNEDQITPEVLQLKIIIAEDDQPSEMLISIAINFIAKEVIRVKTGIEAVKACRNNPDIDLVLMDIQMPEMDGYEATRQIRKFNNKVVIIAQTAYGFSGDRENAIEAGCNEYLSKPIKKEELLGLIKSYYNK